MANRGFSSAAYRYGFNGKEKETDGTADNYDFGARIYNGRLGRWLSVDPEAITYTSNSTYHFCNNQPITAVDKNGCNFEFTITNNVIEIKALIFSVNAETTAELSGAVAAWNALNGTEVLIDGKAFTVNISLTIQEAATPKDAWESKLDDIYSNIYFGENDLNADGTLEKRTKIREITEGESAEIVGGTTAGGVIKMNHTVINTKYGDGTVETKEIHHGKRIRSVAHEIGHLLGLDDFDTGPYYTKGGVMEYDTENLPNANDLVNVVQKGVDKLGGKSITDVKINATNDTESGIDMSTAKVTLSSSEE
jgi:RHS repeat-associated protein